MKRVVGFASAALLAAALVACDDGGRGERNSTSTSPVVAAPPPVPPRALRGRDEEKVTVTGSRVKQYNLNFTVSHDLELFMAEASVKQRFERARDLCLNDPAYECVLRSASISSRRYNDKDWTTAELSVLVRKEKVVDFETALRAPVPGEAPESVTQGERQTSTKNVTASLEDRRGELARKTQLRDRFLELQKRQNLGAEDLIRIEEQLSELNSDIKDLTESISDTEAEVAKDRLEITLRTKSDDSSEASPFGKVWSEAGEILQKNAISALRFLIASIPWIPFGVIGLFVAFRLVRAWRRG